MEWIVQYGATQGSAGFKSIKKFPGILLTTGRWRNHRSFRLLLYVDHLHLQRDCRHCNFFVSIDWIPVRCLDSVAKFAVNLTPKGPEQGCDHTEFEGIDNATSAIVSAVAACREL